MKYFLSILISLVSVFASANPSDCTIYGPNDRVDYVFRIWRYFEGEIHHRLPDGKWERMRSSFYTCGIHPKKSNANSVSGNDLDNFELASCTEFMSRSIGKDVEPFMDHFYQFGLFRDMVDGKPSLTAKATLYKVKYKKNEKGVKVPISRQTILDGVECRLY